MPETSTKIETAGISAISAMGLGMSIVAKALVYVTPPDWQLGLAGSILWAVGAVTFIIRGKLKNGITNVEPADVDEEE